MLIGFYKLCALETARRAFLVHDVKHVGLYAAPSRHPRGVLIGDLVMCCLNFMRYMHWKWHSELSPFPRSHALRGNVNTASVIRKLTLEASGLTFIVGLSPLTATRR
ncbi:MAG: hypothetical protein ACJAZP_000576 [Psychromonas sp.]